MFEDFDRYALGKIVPESYFPEGSTAEKILMPWITVIAVMAFIFLVVFKSAVVPAGQYFTYISLAVTFIPIGLIAFIFNLIELTEEKTAWGDSSTLLGDMNLLKILLISLGIGIFFIGFNFLGSISNLNVFSLKPLATTTFGNILITGLLIPIIENSFFAKFLVPSMFELGGRFKMAGPIGIFIPSLIFGLIHAGAYGVFGMASIFTIVSALMWPVIFRFVTSFAILETKSYLVAFIPHILLNTFVILMA